MLPSEMTPECKALIEQLAMFDHCDEIWELKTPVPSKISIDCKGMPSMARFELASEFDEAMDNVSETLSYSAVVFDNDRIDIIGIEW